MSKVYFTKDISPMGLVKVYKALGVELTGNVAIKLHSGESGNQNFVKPEFVKDIISYVGGTVVECNTAYPGSRNTTKKHLKTMEKHGWNKYFNVDIMDETDDIEIPIKNGKILKTNYVGSHIDKYDSMLVLSHFKGHPMGGYGGALKQLSIGVASSNGKSWIHSGGKVKNQKLLWINTAQQEVFLEAMADAASSVIDYFDKNIVYINMMVNMSVDCDCCHKAEDPCMKDIGILASIDPVAIDKACIDLVEKSNDEGKEHLMERINSRLGKHTIEAASDLGIGNTTYELIEV